MTTKTLPTLRIGDLEINPPIIQGGMGVRVSGSGLASAVANEGCAGIIANDGEIANVSLKNRINESFGSPDSEKTSDHYCHTVV